MGRGRGWRSALGLSLLAAVSAAAATEPDDRWSETGRFYLYVLAGQTFVLDGDLPGGIDVDTPDGFNFALGGGLGYSITDHWGVELQIQGTEPDLRSPQLGKVAEYSNFTVMPAARFRWPLGDGRLIPWVTAGLGLSANDINDSANAAVRMRTDETTIAGSLAAGLDYLVTEDMSIGLGLHSFLYPDQDVSIVVRDPQGREQTTTGSMNYTSLALLAHLKLFLGQAASAGESRPRRLFLADHGPFDTDAMRGYVVGLFGYTSALNESVGGGVTQNAGVVTVGGALGLNFDQYWGAEVQLLVGDRKLEQSPYGKLGEMSTFAVVPTLRFRYPFLGGRLVPFWTAGVGVGFIDPNDHRSYFDTASGVARPTPSVDTGGPGVVGTVGVGVEYFLNRHLSAGVAIPVQFGPTVDTIVQNPGEAPVRSQVKGASVGGMLRLTAYVP